MMTLEKTVTERDFRIRAQTGDIILFKSTDMISKLQRGFTKAEFDHVGIIIRVKSNPHEIFFLEAVSSGVRINSWSQVRQYVAHSNNSSGQRLVYGKVPFRHVNIKRNMWLNQMMYKFMMDTLGKEYEIFGMKLFKSVKAHHLNDSFYSQSDY